MRWTLATLGLGALLAVAVLLVGASIGSRPGNVDCFGNQACEQASATSFPIGFAVAAAVIFEASIIIAVVHHRRT